MNDDIEKINEQNRELSKPSEGDFSQAKDSSITTNEEDSKKSMAENIILDLGNQRQDIDFLKETCKTLLNETNDIKRALNQITQVLNQSVQGTPKNPASGVPQQGLNMESLSALGDLAEKAVSAYKNLKGSPQAAPALIDQDFINKKMRESFMDNLETGEAITNFIKDSLKKKVTKEVINTSLADMGKDNHAPQ